MSAVLSVVDPKNASEAVKKFRAILFPEEAYDDIQYLKKAQDYFKKMRGVDMSIKPVD